MSRLTNLIELKRKVAKPIERMTFYTIYDHPSDYPNNYVMRKWSVVDGKAQPVPGDAVITVELKTLHNMMPVAAINLGRNVHDDPSILETWVT